MLLPSDRDEAKAVVLELRATLAELEADAKTNLNLDLNLGKCALLLPATRCCRRTWCASAGGMRVALQVKNPCLTSLKNGHND